MNDNGTLNFVLGLNAGSFLSGIGQAQAKLLEFAGAIFSVDKIWEGFRSAIERGAALQHLSEETGEAKTDLYKLQEAFTAVGLSADQIPNMLLRMQQALSGIGRGESARPLFAQLGLDVNTLTSMGAAQQIDTITQAMSRLSKQQATGVAAQLFGIETGAQPFLQIVGSAKEFHETMEKVARDAAEFAKNSKAFAQFDATTIEIKSHIAGMFAGIASGLEPDLEKIEERLAGMDLSGIGRQLGRIIKAFANAWSSGVLTELIAVSVSTGFEAGFSVLRGLFEELGYGLLKAFETPLEFLQAGMTFIEEKFMEWIGRMESAFPHLTSAANWVTSAATGGKVGLRPNQGFTADSFSQIMADERKNGLILGALGLPDIQHQANKDFADELHKLPGIFAPLEKMIQGLAGVEIGAGPEKRGAAAPSSDIEQQHYKSEHTSFEKMGFVMKGLGNPMQTQIGLLQQIANNTRHSPSTNADPTVATSNSV